MSYLSHVEYKLIQVLILIISYILLILIKQFIKVSRISRNIIRFSLFLIFLKEVVSYIYRYKSKYFIKSVSIY